MFAIQGIIKIKLPCSVETNQSGKKAVPAKKINKYDLHSHFYKETLFLPQKNVFLYEKLVTQSCGISKIQLFALAQVE